MTRSWVMGAACAIAASVAACGGDDSADGRRDAASAPDSAAGSGGKSGSSGSDAEIDTGVDASPDASADAGGDAALPDAGPTFVTLAVTGDIAQAGTDGSGTQWTDYARDNAAMVNAHSPAVDYVLAVGDISRYGGPSSGITLLEHFNTYYKPADRANWGQFDEITFPTPGNHEYFELDGSGVPDAHGYFEYYATRFGAIKARPDYGGYADTIGKGYYSVDLAGWHVASLNTNDGCNVFECTAGSEQETWLAQDLAQHVGMPTIAFWHEPRYTCYANSTGDHWGSNSSTQALWADLYDAHADFVFGGHLHVYQRFYPLNKAQPAAIDEANGITEIVAGSGGVSPSPGCSDGFDPRLAKTIDGMEGMGVLFITIGSDGSYAWEYRLRSDSSVFDSGSGMSHNAP